MYELIQTLSDDGHNMETLVKDRRRSLITRVKRGCADS